MKGKIEEVRNGGVFAFVRGEDRKRYFFHISVAEKKGWRKSDLREGLEIEFIPGKNEKGLNVSELLSESPSYKNKPKIQDTFQKQSIQVTNNKSLMEYFGNDRNFYLFLNKPYYVEEHSKMYALQPNKKYGFGLNERFVKKKKDKNGNWVEVTGKEKYEVLDNFDFSGIDCSKIVENQKSNAEALFTHTKDCTFKPEWRLTLGLGGASVFDTDITLHHIYGVPYIPASSIKGVVRSWIITEVFGTKEAAGSEEENFPLVNAEFRAITTSESFCKIFGCPKDMKPVIFENGKPKKVKKKNKWVYDEGDAVTSALGHERRGKITFFDALPTDSSKIHISMDIMNVHYKDYYDSPKEKDGTYKKDNMKPPADWSNPTIINFLTVKNTPFQFLLASKDDSLESLKIYGKTIDQWLKEALEEHGIGAKTAVGYGYMTE